jgi:type IV secretory pathway VirB6-like protein
MNQIHKYMKVISTKTHGYLDYIMGVLLIAAPWIFDFADGGPATWVPVVLGISTIIYSLLTNYELGMARVISMRTHLILDAISGVLLAVSPWLFGFADVVWQPHLILGILELGAVLMTRTEPGTGRTPVDRNMRHTPVH